MDLHGPFPADTLLTRAAAGEFDAIVAMYHDQGHIALKLLGMHRAVNITLGTARDPHERRAWNRPRPGVEGPSTVRVDDRSDPRRRTTGRSQTASRLAPVTHASRLPCPVVLVPCSHIVALLALVIAAAFRSH